MYDTHVHTTFSPDSVMKTSEILLRSNAEGFGVTITDHFEFTVEPGIYTFDSQKYFEQLTPFRSDKLLIGVEMGLNLFCQEEILNFVKDYPFDYLLGSIHSVEEVEVYEDNYFQGLRMKEAYSKYLAYVLNCLKAFPFINSLAHFDFITRYAPYTEKTMKYGEFADVLDEIFILLAQREAALEINLKGYQSKFLNNYTRVFKRFKELGGKYVTVGTDAHRITDLGRNLKTGYELAKYCSLRPVYFKNQSPEYISSRNSCAS